ncbi:MAG: EAL domain-containing protein [Lachnospiraceae bacterium]|nr:EAL domain-containing protein [Lachnospiraceae bacterium]
MWSFSFVVPTLLILLIILLFFFSLPRLSIKRNRYFVEMIIAETVTIISDISSSYADNHYELFSVKILYLLNLLYFVVFFTRSFIMYKFTVGILGVTMGASKAVRFIIRIPYYFCVMMSVLSFFDDLVFYVDATGYHGGKLYNILYYCAFFYVLLSFLAVSHFRKRLARRRERYSMLLYNAIIMAGIVIRLLLPRYLLMDTFVLMAVLVVYLAFENPEYYLELRSIVFNSRALREYLEEHTGREDCRCLGIVVRKYHEMRDIYGASRTDEALNMIGRYIVQLCSGKKVFYCRKGRFIVLGDGENNYGTICRDMMERFREAWKSRDMEIYLDVRFAIIELSDKVGSADVILNTMAKGLEEADRSDSEMPVMITEKDLVSTEREMSIKRCLENAIDEDGIELFLQPLVDAETGKVIGAEALSRLRDGNGELIAPGSFIGIAEKNGRINELGDQMFEKTCRFIKDNDIEKMGIKWLNVNLSPIQFMQKGLADRYAAVTKKYGIDPEMIHLEITEESLIDETFMNRQVKAFNDNGFKFVLDDYGTGYSNLARLKKCPFINVKLDISLVRDYCKQPDEILPMMIGAFKNMGFGITSEGVEDDEMAALMRKIGCDYLQGYYYSKPIPVDEFVERYSH